LREPDIRGYFLCLMDKNGFSGSTFNCSQRVYLSVGRTLVTSKRYWDMRATRGLNPTPMQARGTSPLSAVRRMTRKYEGTRTSIYRRNKRTFVRFYTGCAPPPTGD
jgi:hypothetical protein